MEPSRAAEGLIGILMTQIFPSTSEIQEKFRIMTYQAIVGQPGHQ